MQSKVWGQASSILEFSKQNNPITQRQVGLETISSRDTYSSSSWFLFIIPIHLLRYFILLKSADGFENEYQFNIHLITFKTVKQEMLGNAIYLPINWYLSIVYSSYPSTHISYLKSERKGKQPFSLYPDARLHQKSCRM